MPLADLQRQMRDALVTGDGAALGPRLVGGHTATKRLAIHQHHYEASLTAAVVGRFPATGWLIGPSRVEDAARSFVHECPPTAPCIAEYGGRFPAFLSAWPETAPLRYVREFAELDWQLGRLAVSIDAVAVAREQLATIDPRDVADLRVTLQSGVHYLRAAWPVDELITLYLADIAPASWTLRDEDVWLQVRGTRGAFSFSRLRAGEYAFRQALSTGHTLRDAADEALDMDPSFDPGVGLLALVDERLITSIGRPEMGGRA